MCICTVRLYKGRSRFASTNKPESDTILLQRVPTPNTKLGRTVLGVALVIGGILGFLPVLGFWMIPLGVAFVALDVPPARRRLDGWMERLHKESEIDDEHVGLDHPTSNQ